VRAIAAKGQVKLGEYERGQGHMKRRHTEKEAEFRLKFMDHWTVWALC
jgi:hypothetical protein